MIIYGKKQRFACIGAVILLVISAISLLPITQNIILTIGGFLRHRELRRPEKWILLFNRFGLCCIITAVFGLVCLFPPKSFTGKKGYLFIFSSSILCITVLPVLLACLYGVPSADDFSNANALLSQIEVYNGNYLKGGLHFFKSVYMGWQGTYTGDILVATLPYHFGGMTALRIELLLNAVFLFFSCFLFVNTAVHVISGANELRNSYALLLLACGAFFVINFVDVQELFLWHTGLCVYTVPLAFCFITFSAYLAYYFSNTSHKRKLLLVTGMIAAFIAAGGALDISAFLCSVLLFFICYDLFVRKTVKPTLAIGIMAVIGSIINVIAPGNYVRHTVIDHNLRIFSSIFNSVKRVHSVFFSELQTGVFLSCFIAVFILSFFILKGSKISFRFPGIVTLYSYVSCVITDYPVLLGYSSSGSLPARCCFVERVSMIFYLLLLAVYWGGWASKKDFAVLTKEFFMGLSVVCIIPLSLFLCNPFASKLFSARMLFHELKGDYLREAWRQEGIIHDIEYSKEDDVIIYAEQFGECFWTNLKTVGLASDKNNWINIALSSYYNKKSITLKYINTDNSTQNK